MMLQELQIHEEQKEKQEAYMKVKRVSLLRLSQLVNRITRAGAPVLKPLLASRLFRGTVCSVASDQSGSWFLDVDAPVRLQRVTLPGVSDQL